MIAQGRHARGTSPARKLEYWCLMESVVVDPNKNPYMSPIDTPIMVLIFIAPSPPSSTSRISPKREARIGSSFISL